MPLKRGKKSLKSNLHELRHGAQFKRTAKKFGKKRALAQMVAIGLKMKRAKPRKRRK
jgi:hypothetical protein